MLNADVARDPVALGQQLVGRDEPRESTVAVREVDGQEIEDERADERERMRATFALRVLVPGEQLRQKERGLLGSRWSEDDLPVSALVADDRGLIGFRG